MLVRTLSRSPLLGPADCGGMLNRLLHFILRIWKAPLLEPVKETHRGRAPSIESRPRYGS
jgi:hypothetical protein